MKPNRSLYAGMFLAALGLLFFEVLATRVIGFVTSTDLVHLTVSLAMLGMGAAGSVLSLKKTTQTVEEAARTAALFSGLASLFTLGLFAVARMLKNAANDKLDAALALKSDAF